MRANRPGFECRGAHRIVGRPDPEVATEHAAEDVQAERHGCQQRSAAQRTHEIGPATTMRTTNAATAMVVPLCQTS